MGEAKRRKQLGLMPTVFPFSAELGRGGEVRLVQGPEDAAQRALIEKALRDSQSFGAAWDAEYRTVTVLSSRGSERYATREDVERIPVPALRQIDGELALGSAGKRMGAVIPVEGGSVRLRDQRHSFEGETWQTLPTVRDPQQLVRALQQHPAFDIEGESLGQFQVDHWLEGRIDVTPDVGELDEQGETLEFFETLVREFHGQTLKEWIAAHREVLEAQEEEGDLTPERREALTAALDEVPVARRSFFEIRRSAPLQSPLMATAYFRDLEFYLLSGAAYTLDGDTWHPYEDPDTEIEGGGLAPELAEFFDLNMITVTVHSDGRVEWDEDDELSEADIRQLQTDLTESTGAGNPQAWAEWNRTMLQEVLGTELTVPDGEPLPVPVAVRLDIPRDVLGEDNPLSQTYMESEVTFDGEHWRDLYSEEVPEELLPFAAGQGSN